ncbi:class I SAM-dependent methyltransferase [Mucilaginibacter paludis]|uniref:Methyltransferase type 12 n=1 Tax=Mucilaginibacter paludis DSM 18603 TaxID=714943 RepID=H1Y8E7_9SPHI|nr:class I SAM-dependent methyltransferase [Mucilaginibacter paludis]EHQ25865.1 Methyltransferase type 12 [Mucilaginibacter paludis DSM 18603]
MSTIQDQFNRVSKNYDAQRRYLIPCFDDFYQSCLPLVAERAAIKNVLDIGAGTGIFSQTIYQQRPDLHFTLMDISGDMLKVARERFAGLPNFKFIEMDFSANPIAEKYDLIISALAIHHLEDEHKAVLYNRVYQALKPGGLFINADQVEGRSAGFDEFYKSNWKETVNRSELAPEAIERAFERIKLDKFARLETQLKMLETAGFNDTDCIYKYHNFVVMAAFKA